MAGFKFNTFTGIYPRLSESLLPDRAASVAQNCDFAYGELRNTKGAFQVTNVLANQPSSIYTDDGLTYYTWTTDVNAVRSPLVNDTYTRMYYTDGTQMKTASRLGTTINGGVPGTSYHVGVPRPSVNPTAVVTFPNYTDSSKYNLTFRFHYEYQGIKYQEHTVTPATSNSNGTFTFSAIQAKTTRVEYGALNQFPTTGTTGVVYKATQTNKLYTWNGTTYVETTTDATPENASLVVRASCIVRADNTELFDIYSGNSSFTSKDGIFNINVTGPVGNVYTANISTVIGEEDKETRAYVYTFVNIYNEEGPPSNPVIVDTAITASVTLSVTLDAPGSYVPFKEIRVYRTPTGSTIAEYFFAKSLPTIGLTPGAKTIVDDTKAEYLNEPLSSLYYYPPPNGLVGLMTLPNGILAGWQGNDLWFSEPYKAWAWNPNNVKPLPHAIVGGIAHGAGAIITTRATPYAVSGVSSDSMTTTRINIDQAGVSKWSIAVVDGTVMYASHDGLVVISGMTGGLTQSQRFFTRDVWRTRYGNGLSGMRFSVWDGRLVVFHASATFTPFMIRFDEADGTMTELPDLVAKCSFISQLTDQFYFANGSIIYQFNGGTDLTAIWESKEMVVPGPVSYGIMQVVCEGSWNIRFTAALNTPPAAGKQGTVTRGIWTVVTSATQVTYSATISGGNQTIRLPAGFESDRWKVRLVGSGRFRELKVAQTGRELTKA